MSRATNADNPSQGQLFQWAAATRSTCGSSETVAPPNDVAVCNGQFVDTVNDAGQDTILAAYPRQPFDIAGRTGIATFDVNNDTQGPHATWPAFVYTDQPVPAPYGVAAGLDNSPRNSVGFSVATPNCGGDTNMVGVDSMWTTTSYRFADQTFSTVGCVLRASTTRQLNHFEVHISQSHLEVWGTDPGSPTLKQLAVGNFTVPLSRGLIWIEDIHYNACKFDTQCNHTFVWDNVGFDGPVLARDLGFDVLDATHDFTGSANLGYLIPSGRSLTLQIPNVNSLENAAAGLLEFNFWPHASDSLTYAVNGHPAHTQSWPFGADGETYSSHTIALSVPLEELQNGTNSVVLTSSDTINGGLSIANIDLILAGAGTGSTTAAAPAPTQTPASTTGSTSGSHSASGGGGSAPSSPPPPASVAASTPAQPPVAAPPSTSTQAPLPAVPVPASASSVGGGGTSSAHAAPTSTPVTCPQPTALSAPPFIPAIQPAAAAAPLDIGPMPAPLAWLVLASIDPSLGGSIVSADGVFTIQVPARATECALNVSLAAADALTHTTNLQIGAYPYALTITDTLADPVSTFENPLVLTIRSDVTADPASLKVLALNPTGEALDLLPLTVNEDGTFSVLLSVLGPPPPPVVDDPQVTPADQQPE